MWENQTIRKFIRFISIAGRKWVQKLVTDKLKALLSIRGKKNIELAKYTNQYLRNIIIRKRQGNNMVTLKNIRKRENDIMVEAIP